VKAPARQPLSERAVAYLKESGTGRLRYEEAYPRVKGRPTPTSPSWKILGNLGLTLDERSRARRGGPSKAFEERYLGAGRAARSEAGERSLADGERNLLNHKGGRCGNVSITRGARARWAATITDERQPLKGGRTGERTATTPEKDGTLARRGIRPRPFTEFSRARPPDGYVGPGTWDARRRKGGKARPGGSRTSSCSADGPRRPLHRAGPPARPAGAGSRTSPKMGPHPILHGTGSSSPPRAPPGRSPGFGVRRPSTGGLALSRKGQRLQSRTKGNDGPKTHTSLEATKDSTDRRPER